MVAGCAEYEEAMMSSRRTVCSMRGAGAVLEKVGADEGTRGCIYGLVQGDGGSRTSRQRAQSSDLFHAAPGRGERKHNMAPLE